MSDAEWGMDSECPGKICLHCQRCVECYDGSATQRSGVCSVCRHALIVDLTLPPVKKNLRQIFEDAGSEIAAWPAWKQELLRRERATDLWFYHQERKGK